MKLIDICLYVWMFFAIQCFLIAMLVELIPVSVFFRICSWSSGLTRPWSSLIRRLRISCSCHTVQQVPGTRFSAIWNDTLQGTNISPQKGILKMIFLFPRWDMLIPWRVWFWDVDVVDVSVVNLVWINKVILKIARRDWVVLNFTMMWRLPADGDIMWPGYTTYLHPST